MSKGDNKNKKLVFILVEKNVWKSNTLHPPTPLPIFLLGIKGLAVPQQSPVAHQILSSQGHWI